MTGATVNWNRLIADLNVALTARRITQFAAAKEMGVHTSQLTRLRQGRAFLSADNTVRLAAWLYPTSTPHWVRRGSA